MDSSKAFDQVDTFKSKNPSTEGGVKSRRQSAREDVNKRLLFEYRQLVQACDRLSPNDSLIIEINGRKIRMSVVAEDTTPTSPLVDPRSHHAQKDGQHDQMHASDPNGRQTPSKGVLNEQLTRQDMTSASNTILKSIDKNLDVIISAIDEKGDKVAEAICRNHIHDLTMLSNTLLEAIDNREAQLLEIVEKKQIELFERYKQTLQFVA